MIRKPFSAAINYSELNLTNAIKLATETGGDFSEKATTVVQKISEIIQSG